MAPSAMPPSTRTPAATTAMARPREANRRGPPLPPSGARPPGRLCAYGGRMLPPPDVEGEPDAEAAGVGVPAAGTGAPGGIGREAAGVAGRGAIAGSSPVSSQCDSGSVASCSPVSSQSPSSSRASSSSETCSWSPVSSKSVVVLVVLLPGGGGGGCTTVSWDRTCRSSVPLSAPVASSSSSSWPVLAASARAAGVAAAGPTAVAGAAPAAAARAPAGAGGTGLAPVRRAPAAAGLAGRRPGRARAAPGLAATRCTPVVSGARSGARPAHSRSRLTSRACEKYRAESTARPRTAARPAYEPIS